MTERFKVMTFNIRGAQHRDGANAWKRRAKLNTYVIGHHSPDLIGFQELQDGNRRFYDDRLQGYRRSLGPEYENRKPHSYNAIYWDPESLELLDSGGFWLSETPEKFSCSWGARQVRSTNWARFRIKPNGAEFLHLNTHLDHVSVAARRRSARLMVSWADARAGGELPVLITGDFNTEPRSPVHRIFTEAGFEDLHVQAGSPPARTFHRFGGESFVPRRPEKEGRIDWILARGTVSKVAWAPHFCHVVRDAEPPVYPSDHYPVMAGVALESTAA